MVKDDGLPMYICVKCYCQVDTTVEFKKLCEESFHFFKRQLEAFSSSKNSYGSSSARENTNGCESSGRVSSRSNNDLQYQPSLKEAVSFTQHWIIPEDSVKEEDFEPECGVEEEPTTQVFKITGNDESWIDNTDGDTEPAVIKCEPTWDYPNFDFDLSNVKIENGSSTYGDEERVNPLELNPDDLQNADAYSDDYATSSRISKSCKCRSCEKVFSNRREMGFHISVAHRRCGTCGKYFFSNKDKDIHKCTGAMEEVPMIPSRAGKVGQCCHICNKTVKQIRSHLAWHRRRKMKVREILKEPDVDGSDPAQKDSVITVKLDSDELSDDKIKCRLCDVLCSGVKGFKVHVAWMHSDYRIVYTCQVCKVRQFYSRVSCSNHLLKKHGIEETGNLPFELKHASECPDDVKGMLRRKIKKRNNFIPVGSEANRNLEVIDVDCVRPAGEGGTQDNEPLQMRKKKKRLFLNFRRSKLDAPHPPFSLNVPIVPNNFDVSIDANGLKRFQCRGCASNYTRYISAYNHFYLLNKKAEGKHKRLVIENKPFGCNFCSLKFVSASQARMHRIHAH